MIIAVLVLAEIAGLAVLDNLIPLFLAYKYWALFLICFLASLALPLPSNTSVATVAIFASLGYTSFSLTMAVAFAGYVLGDWTGFWLARIYGPRLLQLTGFKQITDYRYFLKAERYINDYPTLTIFLSRFLSAAGPAVNVLTGLTKISFKKFLVFDLTGEALDVLIFALGGYFFGDQFQHYNISLLITGLAIIIFLISLSWRVKLKLKQDEKTTNRS